MQIDVSRGIHKIYSNFPREYVPTLIAAAALRVKG